MAEERKNFTANDRIPTRPLDYEYIGLAHPKELVVDYKLGLVYIVKEDKTIVNITDAIREELGGLDVEAVKDIAIDLDDGTIVTIEAGIVQALNEINTVKESVTSIDERVQTHDNDIAKLKEDVEALTVGSGEDTETLVAETKARKEADAALEQSITDLSKTVTDNKTASDKADEDNANAISGLNNTVTANKQSSDTAIQELKTADETISNRIENLESSVNNSISEQNLKIENLGGVIEQNKIANDNKEKEQDDSIASLVAYRDADILIIKATIAAGVDNWTATDDGSLQKQTINIADIKETDFPIVDIELSEIYDTAVVELENYGYIIKILTFDGKIDVYATEPTSVALNIFIKTDRKSTN